MQSNYHYARLSIASKQQERYEQALVDYGDLIANYPNTKHKNEADRIKNLIFALQKKSKS
jgi:outer membrane protein assembly factor BamD (BamD/ComL family)